MADSKKYYYIKLKEDFFDQDEIRIIEGMPDGDAYVNILLKLYLKSLRNDGKLMLRGRIPFSAEMISTITGKPVGMIKQAMQIFREYGLISVTELGEIYMSDIQNFIGQSSTEADRIREYRSRIKEEEAEKAAAMIEEAKEAAADPPRITGKADSLVPVPESDSSTSDVVQSEAMCSTESVQNSYICTPEIRDKRLETRDKRESKERKQRFSPPSLDEVRQYAREKGYSGFNAEGFWNFYQSKSWMVGKNKMTNWKAAVSGWYARDHPRKERSYGAGSRKDTEPYDARIAGLKVDLSGL